MEEAGVVAEGAAVVEVGGVVEEEGGANEEARGQRWRQGGAGDRQRHEQQCRYLIYPLALYPPPHTHTHNTVIVPTYSFSVIRRSEYNLLVTNLLDSAGGDGPSWQSSP